MEGPVFMGFHSEEELVSWRMEEESGVLGRGIQFWGRVGGVGLCGTHDIFS